MKFKVGHRWPNGRFTVLYDIVTRNIVHLVAQFWIAEFEEVKHVMVYFEVDAAQSFD